jgi:hypothetical protein
MLSAIIRGLAPAGCAFALSSCSVFNYGTHTESLGDGKYMVLTPSIWDAATENRKASEDECPDGYNIVKKGRRPDSAFNVTFLNSDYADYWVIECRSK